MPRMGFSMNEGEGFTVLPKGSYEQSIVSLREGTAKTGTKQYIVKCKIVGGPFDDKTVTHFFAITDKAGYRFRNLLDACGVDYDAKDSGRKNDDGKPIYDLEFDSDDLTGTRFVADAFEDTSQDGKPRNNWDMYRMTQEAQAQVTQASSKAVGAAKAPTVPQTAPEVVGGGAEVPLRRDRRQPTAG